MSRVDDRLVHNHLVYDLVVVAGGHGSRLGGAVKADLSLGGQRLLDRTLAATTDARTRVLVGQGITVPDDVLTTLEDPPSGGPAAGTSAGLAAVTDPAPWTLLLASDLVDTTEGIRALLAAAAADPADADGICLSGHADHPQWLFGIHRTSALQEAVAALGTVRDRSMKALLSSLRLQTLTVAPDTVADIDTPRDLEAWQAREPQTHTPREPKMRDDAVTVARWRAWVEMAAAAVDVDPASVDIARIHTLTKVIAHTYDRPMAPVGSYILGLAVGAAAARGESADVAALQREIERTLDRAPRPEEES